MQKTDFLVTQIKTEPFSFFFFCFPGDVVCSKCQYIFSFNTFEKFFSKSHRSPADMERARDLFIRSKPKPIILAADLIQKGAIPANEVPSNELIEIFQFLGIQKIEPNVFQGLHAFCHVKRKTFYFPMLDIESNIVGYKKLSRLSDDKMIETPVPEQNSFGAVIFSPIVKRGFRDQKTAILVVNMLDALALRMEKNNG